VHWVPGFLRRSRAVFYDGDVGLEGWIWEGGGAAARFVCGSERGLGLGVQAAAVVGDILNLDTQHNIM